MRRLALASAALASIAGLRLGCDNPNQEGGPGLAAMDAASDGGDSAADGAPNAVLDGGAEADAAGDHSQPDVDATGYEWLFDGAWTSVVTQSGCDTRIGDVSKLKWPGFTWQSCGDGCERADVVNGPTAVVKLARRTTSGSRTSNGEAVIYLVAAIRLPPAVQWAAALPLSTWKPSAIVREYGDSCELGFAGNHAGVLQVIAETSTAALGHVGAGVTMAMPLNSIESLPRHFDFAGGWGRVLATSTLGVSSDLKSAVFNTVHSGAWIESPRGAGNAVFWLDWGPPATSLWVWTQAGGARAYVKQSYHVVAHAQTEQRAVWVGATGDVLNKPYETARLYWSPLKLDPLTVVAETPGPVLPITSRPDPMFASGKWIAMSDAKFAQQRILVIDLSSNEIWAIDTPNSGSAGNAWSTPLALSDTTLVAAHAPNGSSQPTQVFYELIRYDLSKLASFAKKL